MDKKINAGICFWSVYPLAHIISKDRKDTTRKFEKNPCKPQKIVLRSLHHVKAMKETLFPELDRNSASPTESADGGKGTKGNTPELTA